MYIVKNVASYEIRLYELRISLKPNQQQDLDLICSRFIADQAGSLKESISKGEIRIVCRDGIGMKQAPFSHAPGSGTKEIIQEMRDLEKRVTDRTDTIIRKHIGQNKTLDASSVDTLNEAIKALQNLVGGVARPKETEEEPVPDGKVVDIQERVINRISKDAKSNIKSDDSKEKANIDKNIDELGDLLG